MTANQVIQSGSNDANPVVPAPEMRRLSDPDGRILTKREVAQCLHKSTRCIDGWMKSGRLSHIKIGRSVLFRWADVQSDLNRFRVNAR